MVQNCLDKVDRRGLNKEDFTKFGQFMYLCKQHIDNNFGRFDWKDKNFKKLCSKYKIQPKGKRSIRVQYNHFWFSAKKTEKDKKETDIAYYFLKHVRNAFAHGNISVIKREKGKRVFLLQDFKQNNKDKDMEQTMQGKIEEELLWLMINTLFSTLK